MGKLVSSSDQLCTPSRSHVLPYGDMDNVWMCVTSRPLRVLLCLFLTHRRCTIPFERGMLQRPDRYPSRHRADVLPRRLSGLVLMSCHRESNPYLVQWSSLCLSASPVMNSPTWCVLLLETRKGYDASDSSTCDICPRSRM